MAPNDAPVDPDWDTPLHLTLPPRAIIHAVFYTAESVHTGWESCVDPALAVYEVAAGDPMNNALCRLIEQEYVEDADPNLTWHDWTVELRLGNVYVVGHWRAPVAGSPADWAWCNEEAERAFTTACALIGRRVRRGLAVEEPSAGDDSRHTRH